MLQAQLANQACKREFVSAQLEQDNAADEAWIDQLPYSRGLIHVLPGTVGRYINAYMPANAGILVTHARQQAADLLSPWQGFGVLCLWTAGATRNLPILMRQGAAGGRRRRPRRVRSR
jgi:hypothetical protein